MQTNNKTTKQPDNLIHISWYCLPDSYSSLGYNPETSSRVTLASLGTGFQPELVVWLFLWFLNEE